MCEYGIAPQGGAHQAEVGGERSPLVVVAAAELEVEQEGVVRHQVEAVGVHQGLAAQRVTGLEPRGVDPTWRRQTGGLFSGGIVQNSFTFTSSLRH